MNKPRSWILMAITILATSLSGSVYAAKKKAAAPTADEAAAMAKMQQYTTPGPNHQILQGLVGRWSVASKMWMKPGDKPEESTGVSENTMIYGGRFLKQEYKGQAMGQPFEGTGYYGYDNVKGAFTSVWLDSMMTGVMTSSMGQYDSATKTIKDEGTFACPMTGEKSRPYRSEWKVIDNDHNVYSMYGPGPDGKEMKSMELTFTRLK